MNEKLEYRLRLYSGLFIAFFLVLHLLNAGLGLLSLAAMDSMGSILFGIWSIPLLSVMLYSAFTVHIVLMFVSLYRRRSLRMPIWNFVQIGLGLLLPWLLVSHVIGTRGAYLLLDVQRDYTQVVTGIWNDPERIFRQIALVVVAWTHMTVGVHYWLRHKPGYRACIPVLYPLCLLIPLLAILGLSRAGIESDQVQAYPATPAVVDNTANQVSPESREFLQSLGDQVLIAFVLMVLAMLLYRFIRSQINRYRGSFSVIHTVSGKTIKGRRGQSVLEALREARIPHTAVCGGRGRCTTCRVRVAPGKSELPQPSKLESSALQRVGAEPNVRLACQIRPVKALTITPLLQPNSNAKDASEVTGVVGHEQQVVCMFVDMRGSTRLGEQKLPFDVVFILNQFFSQLSDALQATNGHYASFNGDGLMALYGLNTSLEVGCTDALAGAIEIQNRIKELNVWLCEEMAQPLKFGIGIHCGEAIVGTMGPPDTPMLSAVGDTINITARLEALTKKYNTLLVVSEAVLRNAQIEHSDLPQHTEQVRGRGGSVEIFLVDEPKKLVRKASQRR